MTKSILRSFLLLGLFLPVLTQAKDNYLSLGVGGDVAVTGDFYTFRDSRFVFQVEGGNSRFALPVSVSFGQGATIVGVKPRVQYLIHPIESISALSVGPGLGLVFNYWAIDVGTWFFQDLDFIELGAQLSAMVRYDVNEKFFVQFTPVALDFNFWRWIWINSPVTVGATSGSNGDFGLIYNILLSAGYHF